VALRAAGYRVSRGNAEHYRTIEALEFSIDPERKIIPTLDKLRRKRNVGAYDDWNPRARVRTFRNPGKKVRAYFLPDTPAPGSACRSCAMRALGTRRHVAQRDRPHFLELRGIAPDVHELRAAARCRWAAETARTDKRLRRARHSRPCARRCRAACPDRLRRGLAEERKIPPRCRPGLHCGIPSRSAASSTFNLRMDLSPSIIGVIVGSMMNCAPSSSASAFTPG
jgi:hypothetical protein